MSLTDMMVTPVATALVAAFAAQLAREANPPEKVGLRIGPAAGAVLGPDEDECCAGLGWVRVSGILPSDEPPGPQSQLRTCGPATWIATFELGVARCIPWGSGVENLNPLTQEDWDNAFADQMADFTAMFAAVECTFAGTTYHYAVGQFAPQEVSGGCTASTLSVQVELTLPCAVPC